MTTGTPSIFAWAEPVFVVSATRFSRILSIMVMSKPSREPLPEEEPPLLPSVTSGDTYCHLLTKTARSKGIFPSRGRF